MREDVQFRMSGRAKRNPTSFHHVHFFTQNFISRRLTSKQQ